MAKEEITTSSSYDFQVFTQRLEKVASNIKSKLSKIKFITRPRIEREETSESSQLMSIIPHTILYTIRIKDLQLQLW